MIKKKLHVVLGNYRSGSTTLAQLIADRLGTTNHHEYFSLLWTSDGRHLSFRDHEIPYFEENDVVKVMGDILEFYPRLLHNIEKRYDVEYSLIYRRDFYSQLISFVKADIAAEKFKDNFYSNTPYPETLQIDMEIYEDLFLDRAGGLLRACRGLDSNFNKRKNLFVFEESYDDEDRYNQPHKIVKPLRQCAKDKLQQMFNDSNFLNLDIYLEIID